MNPPNSLAPEPTTSAKSGVIRSINTVSLQTVFDGGLDAIADLRGRTGADRNARECQRCEARYRLGDRRIIRCQRPAREGGYTKSPDAAGAGVWNDRRGVVDDRINGTRQQIADR